MSDTGIVETHICGYVGKSFRKEDIIQLKTDKLNSNLMFSNSLRGCDVNVTCSDPIGDI